MKLEVLTIKYDTAIPEHEIPLFRGAVVAAAGRESCELFHNHEEDGFRYSYPLVQYKRLGGKPAVVSLQQGAFAVQQYLLGKNQELTLKGQHTRTLRMESVEAVEHELAMSAHLCAEYRLTRWLPLNSSNYAAFIRMDGLAERVEKLEHILIGNLLSMAGGFGIYVDAPILVKISDLCGPPCPVRYKNVKMMAFDVVFKTNVHLPEYIGLGKGSSRGFGIVRKKNSK